MYVLLGAHGNITSKAAARLLAQGAPVRVIGRRASALAPLQSAGAQVAAGDLSDRDFLAQAFSGATAVYTMIPSDYAAPDIGAAQDRLGEAIAAALAAAGVPRIVNLSSIGAHLPAGTGPIAGLHRQEQRLNALGGVDLLHLRPGYFYENHLAAIGTIRALGCYADMTAPDTPLPMVATADIARVVARELLSPSANTPRSTPRVLHLRAEALLSMRQAAACLGAAIGRPDLPYVQGDPQQVKAALMQHGFSAGAAASFEEMSAAFSDGRLNTELEKGPTEIAPMTLEQFAREVFSAAYASGA